MGPKRANSCQFARLAIVTATLAILFSILVGAGAQSSKGQKSTNSYSAPQSPVAQARQQQQQQNYAATNRPAALATKRRPQQQTQPIQQQQQQSYQQQQQREDSPQAATEDPLSDSEPALYGSVAGAPGVDFPAYTRIPKTSFTCEGKGFDFGFYADEEAGCQVYHVCWSGRHESFLCGVGTVFNQAILACDYWHSVDCSKSSQFYSVNGDLGKAGAEPASVGTTQRPRSSVTLPSNSNPVNPGDSFNQRRPQAQQQQYNANDDANFEAPQQQQQLVEPQTVQQQSTPVYRSKGQDNRQPAVSQQRESFDSTNNGFGSTFAPQRSQSYDYQQQIVHSPNNNNNDNGATKRLQSNQQTPPTTTLATPPAVKRPPRINMDFNQKVNSLIESPVRAPLKTSPANAAKQRQQQQQQPINFAQMAVARAQRTGSQNLNQRPARKTSGNANYQQQSAPALQQQQQKSFDAEPSLDNEPQQQQQNFDDSPVQTSTATYNSSRQPSSTTPTSLGFIPQQQQQTVIRSGGGADGSSAITTQFDTLAPANNNNYNGGSSDSSYESSLDDSTSGLNDDFRSAGAKAAASQNQNWYIMRTI